MPLYCQTLDDELIPTNNNNNQWQSRPASEWNSQQVSLWLVAMSMDQYAKEFSAKGVDGTQLLNMDSEKLKVMGNIHIYIYMFFFFKWLSFCVIESLVAGSRGVQSKWPLLSEEEVQGHEETGGKGTATKRGQSQDDGGKIW